MESRMRSKVACAVREGAGYFANPPISWTARRDLGSLAAVYILVHCPIWGRSLKRKFAFLLMYRRHAVSYCVLGLENRENVRKYLFYEHNNKCRNKERSHNQKVLGPLFNLLG